MTQTLPDMKEADVIGKYPLEHTVIDTENTEGTVRNGHIYIV